MGDRKRHKAAPKKEKKKTKVRERRDKKKKDQFLSTK
jgi:hypothetical protein